MIYLDTSALMKLVRQEAESLALRNWFADKLDLPLVSSELAKVELLRSARRAGTATLLEARALVDQLFLMQLSGSAIDMAAEIGEPMLRSLDALHLASAVLLGDDLTDFVTYDHRLAAAAAEAGLPVTTPGTNTPDVNQPG